MKHTLTVCLLLASLATFSQERPKIIIGIVVDQMRTDYLYRYWDKFGDNGFKKLVNEGYFCQNTHFNYVPTYTGPGHASIYTGCTPSGHGIIANDWYDRAKEALVYCASDNAVQTIGSASDAGRRSPKQLLTTTLGDQLKLHSQFRSRVIGISLKDRSAILPAGRGGDAAYWFDQQTGAFVSSSWYMDSLPKWLQAWNESKPADEYTTGQWETLLHIDNYTESYADDNPYEQAIDGKDRPVFPYDLKKAFEKSGYAAVTATPFGNTLVTELAIKTLQNEPLGTDQYPDLLAISYSSTDIIGHIFGPQAVETEDTYLRLDQEIARLLDYLHLAFEPGEFALFLTADHAGSPVPKLLTDHKMPGGYLNDYTLETNLAAFTKEHFAGAEIIENYYNQQVYLDTDAMDEAGISKEAAEKAVQKFFAGVAGVSEVISAKDLKKYNEDNHFVQLARMGHHPLRSGDFLVNYLPGWMSHPETGTTHGSAYSYDTHVPLIFYGRGFETGSKTEEVEITQIVPTLCLLLKIAFPPTSGHIPVSSALK